MPSAVLFRPLVGRLLFNTLALVAASTLCAGALGTAAAFVLERTAVPGKRVWSALVVAPLAVPAFIASYAWVSLSPNLQDFAGALLVVTASYYPLVYLPVAATLRNMDPAFEETARSLGCGPLGVLRACGSAASAPRAVRRDAARRAECAGRVRRLLAVALPHFHHGNLRGIQDRLQWPGGLSPGSRSARLLLRLSDP